MIARSIVVVLLAFVTIGCGSEPERRAPAPTPVAPAVPEPPTEPGHRVSTHPLPEVGQTWTLHRFAFSVQEARLSVHDAEFEARMSEVPSQASASRNACSVCCGLAPMATCAT